MNIEDKYIKHVIAVKAKKDELHKKYGAKVSGKVQEELDILADFYRLYEEVVKERDSVRELNRLYRANFVASNMIREKRKLSYEDQAKLMGFDKNDWKLLDTVDEEINNIKKMMDE